MQRYAHQGRERNRDQKCRPVRTQAAHQQDGRDRQQSYADRRQVNCRQCIAYGHELRRELRWLVRDRQAEQFLDLACRDNDGDTGRESDRHRKRNIFDVGAQAQQCDRDQNQAGDHRCERQAVIAVSFDDAGDQADESAGRPADLESAAAHQRHDQAAGNRRVKSALGRYAGSDGNGHRQRQRNHGDGQSRDGVGAQIAPAIALAENRDQLWGKQLDEGWIGCA